MLAGPSKAGLADPGNGAPAEGNPGPDHYRLAEELLVDWGVLDDVLVEAAQAHATLALAAATALASDFDNCAEEDAWRQLTRPRRAHNSAVRLLAEVSVQGWSSPSTRRRRARVSSSSSAAR